MVLKQEIVIEVTKDTHVYRLSIPVGSPLGQCRDVVIDMLYQVFNMVKESDDKLKKELEKKEAIDPVSVS